MLFRSATNAESPWFRVLLALYVDFASYIIVAIVPLCLLALWLESNATGAFAWQFERDFARPSDVLTSALALVAFPGVWTSFGIPMWTSCRSPGLLLAGVVLQTTQVPFWRYAVFGIFQYFALAAPAFRDVFNVGGLQARASTSAIEHAG